MNLELLVVVGGFSTNDVSVVLRRISLESRSWLENCLLGQNLQESGLSISLSDSAVLGTPCMVYQPGLASEVSASF